MPGPQSPLSPAGPCPPVSCPRTLCRPSTSPLHLAGVCTQRTPSTLAEGASRCGSKGGTLGERLFRWYPASSPLCCSVCLLPLVRRGCVWLPQGRLGPRASLHSAWPAAHPHISPFNWAFSLTECHASLFCQCRHNLCSLKPGGVERPCSRNSSRPLGDAQLEQGRA